VRWGEGRALGLGMITFSRVGVVFVRFTFRLSNFWRLLLTNWKGRDNFLNEMKTISAVVLLMPCMTLMCVAQPVRLTGFDRAGNLTWTNLICTTQPVYELLRADSLTSPWEHLAFVTNENGFSISDALDTATGAGFFRIAWVDEPPLVFDYAFTVAGLGLTTVTGRLEVAFAGSTSGTRSFSPTDYYDVSSDQHPIGDAPLGLGRQPYSRDGVSLQVFLKGSGGEGSIYLDGALERSGAGGRCVYTRYCGIVWLVGFETEGIGTFVATRVP